MKRDRNYPGVSKFLDRRGGVNVWRWRVRVRGKGKLLPGEYGSPEFVAAWQAYVGKPKEPGEHMTKKGSINELLVRYYQSPEFLALEEDSTRENYRRTLERLLREKNGHKKVAELTRQAIIAKRDKLKPHASNNFLRAIKHLCKFAVERQILSDDPTATLKKIKLAKTDGYHTITVDEVDQFEAGHPIGTQAHLASKMLGNFAVRRADLVKLGRQHEINGGTALRIRHKKTGKKTGEWLVLPITPELRAAIDAYPSKGLTYLETKYGRPFTAKGFGNRMRKWCDAVGLHECSTHSWRKGTATQLANLGATTQEIMAITGHKTLAEVERYTKAADQERLAKRGTAILRRAKEERISGNGETPLGNEVSNQLKAKG